MWNLMNSNSVPVYNLQMCARVNFSYLISQYYSFLFLFYSIKYSLVLHIIILNDVAIAQMRLFVLYLSRYLAWPELIFRRILIIVPADLSLKSIKISLNELNKCLQITDFCKFVVIVFFFFFFLLYQGFSPYCHSLLSCETWSVNMALIWQV